MFDMSNPITYSLVGGFIAVLLVFLNNKFKKKEEPESNQSIYIKIFLMVSGIIYFINSINSKKTIQKSGGGTEIYTGNPNF